MEESFISACPMCLKPFVDGGPDNQMCEHNAWIVKTIRATRDEALERAAVESESVLRDEPGRTIVEIPRLIRALKSKA